MGPGRVPWHPKCPDTAKATSDVQRITSLCAGGRNLALHITAPSAKGFQPPSPGLSAFRLSAAVPDRGDGFDAWHLLHEWPANTSAGVSPSACWCDSALKRTMCQPCCLLPGRGESSAISLLSLNQLCRTHPLVTIKTSENNPEMTFAPSPLLSPHSSYLSQDPGWPSPAVRAPRARVDDVLWLWQR